MGAEFTLQERAALFALMADGAEDTVIKTDRNGFVLTATPTLDGLGVNLPGMLIGPHLRDLVAPSHARLLDQLHAETMAGQGSPDWHEFPGAHPARSDNWFALRMHPLRDPEGRSYGTICLIRSIADRKSLERKVFEAELTDPLTGLTNRMAFKAMLSHLAESRATGCLALFQIDWFMALNLRHGEMACDELLCAFAGLLRELTRREDILSRIGGDRFGVLMPRLDPQEAARLAEAVTDTVAALGHSRIIDAPGLTVSAGIASIAPTLDATLERAEMALFGARAKGRSRVEISASDGGHDTAQFRARNPIFLAFGRPRA